MPNWIEGSLKMRGSIDNILNFVKNGMAGYEYKVTDQNIREPVEIPINNWLDTQYYDEKDPGGSTLEFKNGLHWIYIKDTKRAFVNNDLWPYIHIYKTPTDGIYIAVMAIKQAWGFEYDDWINISKKYKLDLKLYGIEGGMGFYDELNIIAGQLVKNESKVQCNDYSSFAWNCPFPWMGG